MSNPLITGYDDFKHNCICQSCGEQFSIDLLIPDELWAKITPKPETDGGGLLCGSCIMKRLEKLAYEDGKYDYWKLTKDYEV